MNASLRNSPVLALALVAAACGQAPEVDAPDQPAVSQTVPALDTTPPEQRTPAPQSETMGSLVPDTLAQADWRGAQLDGELGCSFGRRSGEDPLLVALADVLDDARGQAAVEIGGKTQKLTMDRTGGFSAMSKGARFTGADGLVANVVVTGDSPIEETPSIAMESPRNAATLTVARDGQTIELDGFYECGP